MQHNGLTWQQAATIGEGEQQATAARQIAGHSQGKAERAGKQP